MTTPRTSRPSVDHESAAGNSAFTPAHIDDIAQSFSEHHARGASPSVVWALFDRTSLVRADARGTLHDGSIPGPDTAYRIASCTKSFTAAAILALRDEGRVGLDSPITQFVPAFSSATLPTVDSPVPTVRMLLTMSAGLPTDDPWGDRQESISDADLDALLRRGLSFDSVPGTRFAYSNLGYALLGRVVTQASGIDYRDFIAQRFLDPLGLQQTGFDSTVAARGGVAAGARWLDGSWDYLKFSGPGAFSPIGGLFSTLTDLSTWAQWLASAFEPRSESEHTDAVLSRSSRREMQQLHRFTPDLPSHPGGYGFGLFVQHYPDGETVVSHSGGYPGFSAHMRWSTRSGHGIVAFENATYSRVSAPTTEAFDRVLVGQRPSAHPTAAQSIVWPATRSAQDAITALVNDWHDDPNHLLFAENVELDEPFTHRHATLTAAIAVIGGLVTGGRSDSTDESSGTPSHLVWFLPGHAGRLRIEIQLTPENPPRVQTLKFSPDRVGR